VILLIAILVLVVAQPPSPWGAAILLAGCVLEVGEVLVLRRWSHRLGRRYPARGPVEELVGGVADVVTPCRPNGQVRVRGEIWEATCADGADEGSSVRVERVEGLTLVVSPAADLAR